MFTCVCTTPPSSCTQCSATPTQFQVVLAGIANSACLQCATVNITATLDVRFSCASGLTDTTKTPNLCRWEKDVILPGWLCTPGGTPVTVILWQSKVGSNYFTTVYLASTTFSGVCAELMLKWEYDHGTSVPDCTAFSSLSVPWVSNISGSCNGSGSTATVTSL